MNGSQPTGGSPAFLLNKSHLNLSTYCTRVPADNFRLSCISIWSGSKLKSETFRLISNQSTVATRLTVAVCLHITQTKE